MDKNSKEGRKMQGRPFPTPIDTENTTENEQQAWDWLLGRQKIEKQKPKVSPLENEERLSSKKARKHKEKKRVN